MLAAGAGGTGPGCAYGLGRPQLQQSAMLLKLQQVTTVTVKPSVSTCLLSLLRIVQLLDGSCHSSAAAA